MALVVEDGTGVAGANSFVTAEELIAYAALRGVAIELNEVDRLNAEAMDFIEAQCYWGNQVFPDGLPFPRFGMVEGDELLNYVFTIPKAIKKAQSQLVLDAKRGIKLNTSASNDEAVLKSEKIGPIEESYFAPPSNVPTLPIAMAALAFYLCENEPFKGIRTYRV